MPKLIPARCPIPILCGGSWHWGNEARRACQRRQDDWKAKRRPDEIDVAELRPPGIRHARERARAEKLSTHTPKQPELAEDAALVSNGERQLIGLASRELSAVGILLSTDVHRINSRLRCGKSLVNQDPGPAACHPAVSEKFTSEQAIVDVAAGAFYKLGPALLLNESVRLFRGIGIPEEPTPGFPDVAEIAAYIRNPEASRGSELTDAGFGFACADPNDALCYDGSDAYLPRSTVPVLLQLDVAEGLCIPGPEYRSPALFEHCLDTPYLANGSSQIILPPGTRWKVVSTDPTSPYGVALVHMKQI